MLIFWIIRKLYLINLFKNLHPTEYSNMRHYKYYTAREIEIEKQKLKDLAEQVIRYRKLKKTAARNSFAERYYNSKLVLVRNEFNASKNRMEVFDEITKVNEANKKFYKKFIKVLDFSQRV